MDFNDLAAYSEQMPGRKTGADPKKQGLSGMTIASGALQGLGAGLMSDDLFKKYNRAGGGYAGLAADYATQDKLLDREQVHEPGEADRLMAENQAKRERIKTSSNMGGKLR